MSLLHIIVYSVIQGLAELLPVSSSAHVIAAAKLMGRLDPKHPDDPTSPQFVSLLVMLHTGTMFAVILYFWGRWKKTFFHSQREFIRFATKITIATGVTGVLGLVLLKGIEKYLDPGYTRLVSYELTTDTTTHDKVTEETLLTSIVASDEPDKKLFKPGETLSFTGKKGGTLNGEVLAYTPFEVKKDSRLKDLLKTFREGFEINDTRVPGNIQPGVTFARDPHHFSSKELNRIVITGNEGSANHLKFKEGFSDQAGILRIGFDDITKGEVEHLFKRLDLISGALAAAGVLIFITGIARAGQRAGTRKGITTGDGIWIGIIQGISLPFRGFSRSGATISLGLLRGITRERAEEFSFALAVVLTPPVLAYEAYRLIEHLTQATPKHTPDFMPGLKGMAFSFIAGLIALKLLSKLLESGQWWLFGVYCLAASGGMWWMHMHGI